MAFERLPDAPGESKRFPEIPTDTTYGILDPPTKT
jgi:hypothetical protein